MADCFTRSQAEPPLSADLGQISIFSLISVAPSTSMPR